MKEKKKMCQQIATLVNQKLRAQDKTAPDNIISLKYKEGTTQEETACIDLQLECTEDNIQEVTETWGNEAGEISADQSLKRVVPLGRGQQPETRVSTRQRKPPVKLSAV
jgi:hypothetical protein